MAVRIKTGQMKSSLAVLMLRYCESYSDYIAVVSYLEAESKEGDLTLFLHTCRCNIKITMIPLTSLFHLVRHISFIDR